VALECPDVSSPVAVPKRIVNLTLTEQSRRPLPGNTSAAWTLQRLSCKTNSGMRVRESGTDLSRRAHHQGKIEV
jgi:hypothetical protein